MLFEISPSSGVPIYRQLVDQVEFLVRGGRLRPGDGLPSVRDVARALQINPMTVSKAYGLLESRGWLMRLRGRGMIVSGNHQGPDAGSAMQALRPAVVDLLRMARQTGVSDAQLVDLLHAVAVGLDD